MTKINWKKTIITMVMIALLSLLTPFVFYYAGLIISKIGYLISLIADVVINAGDYVIDIVSESPNAMMFVSFSILLIVILRNYLKNINKKEKR